MTTDETRDVEALVLSHFGLAKRLARRYARGDRQLMEELEQVAALGLVQAATRFDPSRGTAFSTFAVPTITGELRRYFRSARWAAHVPRRLQEAFLAARETEREMTARDGRPPGAARLAARLGWPLEELLEARAAAAALTPVSLDAPPADEQDGATTPLSERLGAEDPGYRASELHDELEQALATLDPDTEDAVRLRFAEELSFGEVATRLGVSPSHASKLVGGALHELQHAIHPQAA